MMKDKKFTSIINLLCCLISLLQCCCIILVESIPTSQYLGAQSNGNEHVLYFKLPQSISHQLQEQLHRKEFPTTNNYDKIIYPINNNNNNNGEYLTLMPRSYQEQQQQQQQVNHPSIINFLDSYPLNQKQQAAYRLIGNNNQDLHNNLEQQPISLTIPIANIHSIEPSNQIHSTIKYDLNNNNNNNNNNNIYKQATVIPIAETISLRPTTLNSNVDINKHNQRQIISYSGGQEYTSNEQVTHSPVKVAADLLYQQQRHLDSLNDESNRLKQYEQLQLQRQQQQQQQLQELQQQYYLKSKQQPQINQVQEINNLTNIIEQQIRQYILQHMQQQQQQQQHVYQRQIMIGEKPTQTTTAYPTPQPMATTTAQTYNQYTTDSPLYSNTNISWRDSQQVGYKNQSYENQPQAATAYNGQSNIVNNNLALNNSSSLLSKLANSSPELLLKLKSFLKQATNGGGSQQQGQYNLEQHQRSIDNYANSNLDYQQQQQQHQNNSYYSTQQEGSQVTNGKFLNEANYYDDNNNNKQLSKLSLGDDKNSLNTFLTTQNLTSHEEIKIPLVVIAMPRILSLKRNQQASNAPTQQQSGFISNITSSIPQLISSTIGNITEHGNLINNNNNNNTNAVVGRTLSDQLMQLIHHNQAAGDLLNYTAVSSGSNSSTSNNNASHMQQYYIQNNNNNNNTSDHIYMPEATTSLPQHTMAPYAQQFQVPIAPPTTFANRPNSYNYLNALHNHNQLQQLQPVYYYPPQTKAQPTPMTPTVFDENQYQYLRNHNQATYFDNYTTTTTSGEQYPIIQETYQQQQQQPSVNNNLTEGINYLLGQSQQNVPANQRVRLQVVSETSSAQLKEQQSRQQQLEQITNSYKYLQGQQQRPNVEIRHQAANDNYYDVANNNINNNNNMLYYTIKKSPSMIVANNNNQPQVVHYAEPLHVMQTQQHQQLSHQTNAQPAQAMFVPYSALQRQQQQQQQKQQLQPYLASQHQQQANVSSPMSSSSGFLPLVQVATATATQTSPQANGLFVDGSKYSLEQKSQNTYPYQHLTAINNNNNNNSIINNNTATALRPSAINIIETASPLLDTSLNKLRPLFQIGKRGLSAAANKMTNEQLLDLFATNQNNQRMFDNSHRRSATEPLIQQRHSTGSSSNYKDSENQNNNADQIAISESSPLAIASAPTTKVNNIPSKKTPKMVLMIV